METGMGLEKLKKNYLVLQEKYNLPEFKEMNEYFSIEKIAENETEILTAEIRKIVGDRLANYMRLIENLLNPVNVPMFVFSIVKLIGPEEKKTLSEIYKKLIKNEIKLLERDLEFNEKKDTDFIKESFELWKEVRKEFYPVLEKFDKSWENKTEENSRGYFG